MNKKETVYQYLKGLEQSGTYSNADLLTLNASQLKEIAILKDIGKTTLKDVLAKFKRELRIQIPDPRNRSIDSTIDSNRNESTNAFLMHLQEKEDALFQMIEQWESKSNLKDLYLSKKGADEVKEKIIRQYPIQVPPLDACKGLGTKINSELFNEFQKTIKKTKLSQRYAIHLAIKLFNDYCAGILLERNIK